MEALAELEGFKPQKDDTIVIKIHGRLGNIECRNLAKEVAKAFPNNLAIILPDMVDIGMLSEKQMNKCGWFKVETK